MPPDRSAGGVVQEYLGFGHGHGFGGVRAALAMAIHTLDWKHIL